MATDIETAAMEYIAMVVDSDMIRKFTAKRHELNTSHENIALGAYLEESKMTT